MYQDSCALEKVRVNNTKQSMYRKSYIKHPEIICIENQFDALIVISRHRPEILPYYKHAKKIYYMTLTNLRQRYYGDSKNKSKETWNIIKTLTG
ncbi:hypothetical protein WA026_021899 [Henosepilachna vigintioctopunctata]|uniref:Uncharacterized protein n=1 Tax=Henosepilachna vigintioctopunctata TaxID=420089 RepID=A0AAW1UG08_9CUCU